MLDQLEEYRAATPAQRAQDLTHLLTGKNLAEPPSQSTQTVGIANLAAVCEERLGTSLTQGTFGAPVDALIMAHEFGHNFGAPHDGEPGACASEATTYIMARTVNHSQQFSACSIAQMQPWLVAPCLDVLAAGDVEVRFANAPPDAMMGEEFEVEVVVDNPSSSDAHGIEVTAAGSDLTVRQMTAASAEGFACRENLLRAHACRRTVLPSRSSARSACPRNYDDEWAGYAAGDRSCDQRCQHFKQHRKPCAGRSTFRSNECRLLPTVVRVGEAFEYVVTLRNAGNITGTNAIGRVNLWPGSLNVVGSRPMSVRARTFTTGSTTVLSGHRRPGLRVPCRSAFAGPAPSQRMPSRSDTWKLGSRSTRLRINRTTVQVMAAGRYA